MIVVSGALLLVGGVITGGGCTVQQQQEVLGTIGKVIPGSSNSVFTSSRSPQTVSDPPPQGSPTASPAVTVEKTDAQWVLQTMQRAMADNPSPFQECLDNPPCKLAFTAHLIQLQKQAGGTLELPAIYDRYDLKRGRE
jgi:hypothetical protein